MTKTNMEEAASDAIVSRAEQAVAKLKNGAGTVATCPAHSALAHGVVCSLEMLIPVYKDAASRQNSDMPEIKSKYFSAKGGAAMYPLSIILCVWGVCYTIIQLWSVK